MLLGANTVANSQPFTRKKRTHHRGTETQRRNEDPFAIFACFAREDLVGSSGFSRGSLEEYITVFMQCPTKCTFPEIRSRIFEPSPRRKPGSSDSRNAWIPASAGMTVESAPPRSPVTVLRSRSECATEFAKPSTKPSLRPSLPGNRDRSREQRRPFGREFVDIVVERQPHQEDDDRKTGLGRPFSHFPYDGTSDDRLHEEKQQVPSVQNGYGK